MSANPKQSSSTPSSVETEGDRITHSVSMILMCQEHAESNNSKQTNPPVLKMPLTPSVSVGPQRTAVADMRIQGPF